MESDETNITPEAESPRFKLNRTDLASIGRGILIASGGAALTYLAPLVTQIDYTITIKGHPFDLSPIAVIVLSAAINAARKWITDHTR